MKRLLVTVFLLGLTQQGYASCMDRTPEDMSYYIYMEEESLKKDFCLCEKLGEIERKGGEQFSNLGAHDEALKSFRNNSVIAKEQTKILRVLKKDYGLEEVDVEC